MCIYNQEFDGVECETTVKSALNVWVRFCVPYFDCLDFVAQTLKSKSILPAQHGF